VLGIGHAEKLDESAFVTQASFLESGVGKPGTSGVA